MSEEKNKIGIPGAIVLAGILIAGGIFLSNQKVEVKGSQTNIDNTISVREDDHILGNPEADVLLIEYSDLECPACQFFHMVMNQIMDEYGKSGKVAWVFRHSPIESLHSKSMNEAEAAECAASLGGENVFWKFINKIYEITPGNNGLDPKELPKTAVMFGVDEESFNECLSSGSQRSKVEKGLSELVEITKGSLSTPYIQIVLKDKLTENKILNINNMFGDNMEISSDGKVIKFSGAYQYEAFKYFIDLLLQ